MAEWSVIKSEFLKDHDYRTTGESAFKLLALKEKLNEGVIDRDSTNWNFDES